MEPYLVCVILRPTPKEKEDGKPDKLVVDGRTVLANDTAGAGVKALRLVPPEFVDFESRLEVRVIPFRRSG